MAELTIQLVVDPTSGKKNVIIGYSSDSDALPMEHEEDHRRLALEVLAKSGIDPADLGEIIIGREGDSASSDETATEESGSVEGQTTPRSISEDQ